MMRRHLNVAAIALAAASAVTFLAGSTPAHAQAARAFVSGHGTDTGTCAVTAPCRSFAYAVTQTAVAGEIVVLDSAGYGTVTISQSMSITNPGGVEAGITTGVGSAAIVIAPTVASDITLRGLTLEGGTGGGIGIDVASQLPEGVTSTLTILGCVVKDFDNAGLLMQASAEGAGSRLNIVIADSVFTKNGIGISFTPEIVNLVPTIYRTLVENNTTGINFTTISGTHDAALVDTHVDNNLTQGVTIGANVFVTMKASTIDYNGFIAFLPESTNDLSNAGNVLLMDHNLVGSMGNSGIGSADGTNIIMSLSGNPLSKLTPQ